MTPKEKAEELVNKFREFADGIDFETDRYSPRVEKEKAKQCAIIAVDEIAKCTKHEKQKFENDRFSEHYWDEVKQEIEKL